VSGDDPRIESDTGPWAAVPAWVLESGVSSRAIHVYAVLSLLADGGVGGSGAMTRSRRGLAGRVDCSVDTLDRAVLELEAIGALDRSVTTDSAGDQGPNRWKVRRARPGSGTSAATRDRAGAALSLSRPPEEPDLQEQTLLEDVPSPVDRVQVVFDAWIAATKKTAATKLDRTRRARIEKALAGYPLDDVLDAVRGWDHSPFHRGENPTSTVYNDLGLLLRDSGQIEKFRDLARGPRLVDRSTKSPTAHLSTADSAMAEDPNYWKEPT
jgi:hypothetical protein